MDICMILRTALSSQALIVLEGVEVNTTHIQSDRHMYSGSPIVLEQVDFSTTHAQSDRHMYSRSPIVPEKFDFSTTHAQSDRYMHLIAGSWPLLDLNWGLTCAWGLASHEATALAWSWAWAWVCLAGPGACAWALASAFAWASLLLCALALPWVAVFALNSALASDLCFVEWLCFALGVGLTCTRAWLAHGGWLCLMLPLWLGLIAWV